MFYVYSKEKVGATKMVIGEYAIQGYSRQSFAYYTIQPMITNLIQEL